MGTERREEFYPQIKKIDKIIKRKKEKSFSRRGTKKRKLKGKRMFANFVTAPSERQSIAMGVNPWNE